MRPFPTLAGLVALAFISSSALAAGPDIGNSVQVHGFGGWAFGDTDGNSYLSGTAEGSYSNAHFYLNLSAEPTENLTISAQTGWFQNDQGSDVDFDYAFAEWKHSDALRIRFGRVKHPWGIYGEILRVGTLRPFLDLPQGIYGPRGSVGNGYNGVGFTGQLFAGGGWSFNYDLYGGLLRADYELPNLVAFAALPDPQFFNDGIAAVEVETKDMIGGRLNVNTPLQGLRFGASGYFGSTDDTLSGVGDKSQLGLHLEYASERLLIRSEVMREEQRLDTNFVFDSSFDSEYLEVAWKFDGHWQIAGRYDNATTDFLRQDIKTFPVYLRSYFEHRDLALGVNYWFSQDFVLKLSYHSVEGIRFSNPTFDNALPVLLEGAFEDETKLVQFGAQFSF